VPLMTIKTGTTMLRGFEITKLMADADDNIF